MQHIGEGIYKTFPTPITSNYHPLLHRQKDRGVRCRFFQKLHLQERGTSAVTYNIRFNARDYWILLKDHSECHSTGKTPSVEDVSLLNRKQLYENVKCTWSPLHIGSI